MFTVDPFIPVTVTYLFMRNEQTILAKNQVKWNSKQVSKQDSKWDTEWGSRETSEMDTLEFERYEYEGFVGYLECHEHHHGYLGMYEKKVYGRSGGSWSRE